MELKSTRNSLRSLQEEHTQVKQELQATQQEKIAADESLKQLSEVCRIPMNPYGVKKKEKKSSQITVTGDLCVTL